MIIRIWRVKVTPDSVDKWDDLLGENAVNVLKKQKGCLHVFAAKNLSCSPPEVVSITVWEDLKSVKNFFGAKWREAYVTPEEAPLIVGEAKLEQFDSMGHYCSGK